MGIRYYAYPLDPEFVEHARVDPYLFISDDPLADAWGPAEDRPTMLYLDKCWGWLQKLTSGGAKPRPSYRLVEGKVTYIDGGSWYPWLRVLGPAEVDVIATDIVLLDVDHVRALLHESPVGLPSGADRDGEEEYVMHFLRAAQRFMVEMSRKGKGVIYLIG